MKCSDYLWEFCKVVEEMEGQPVAQAKGEVNKRMGYPTFLSDTTGKVMSERFWAGMKRSFGTLTTPGTRTSSPGSAWLS